MANVILRQLSSLEKVFLEGGDFEEVFGTFALKGERISWQILYTAENRGKRKYKASVTVDADPRLAVILRQVGNVPCSFPCEPGADDGDYLKTTPGLFPDVLLPLDESFLIKEEQCYSLFVTCEIPEEMEAGEYPVTVSFAVDGAVFSRTFTVTVLPAVLPAQETVYTQWFHADCLASYYGDGIFSDAHWDRIDQFLKGASRIGVNMILTPIFTLALDTEVGVERPTLQLVDVFRKNGEYSFGFTRLKKWIELCKKHGIFRFELSHFFSQWGTGFAPKIMAETENGVEKIFGWHTPVVGSGYDKFLAVFLPELCDFLKAEGVFDGCRFHVFDEPQYPDHLDAYKTAHAMVKDYLPVNQMMDAISHREFVEMGLVHQPVTLTSSIDDFVKNGITDLWAYTCCLPNSDGYSNRFLAMPSYRNRIVGFQLYRYGIEGFLNWGYNFYYSQLSRKVIDPFCDTCGDDGWPGGDTFSVYPGKDGPLESIRSEVFFQGLQDIRACKLLERFIGRDAVLELIGDITFNDYPRSGKALLSLRETVNRTIAKNLVF